MPPQIDLKLLRCLLTLVAEEHVTRAATRLSMSQPAMSAALSRLREILGDPILIRTDTGMVATERAQEIASAVESGLSTIDRAVLGSRNFDHATSEAHFNIAVAETGTFFLLSPFMGHARSRAPNITISVHRPDASEIQHQLERGSLDLAISFLRSPPPGVRARPLVKTKLMVAVAQAHPEIHGSLSFEQYLKYSHTCYMMTDKAPSTIESCVDEAIVRHGAQRNIAIRLPSVVNSLMIVARTDLLATVPENIARDFASALGLQVFVPPLELPDVEIVMYWHDRTHNSPAHQWLRAQLRDVARRVS